MVSFFFLIFLFSFSKKKKLHRKNPVMWELMYQQS